MSVTGGIMAGIGAAGALGGAAISSSAADNAASQQSAAANHAADLQYQASQNALDFQKQQYNTSQQQMQPWLQTGTGALSNLGYLMGINPMTSQQFGGGFTTGGSQFNAGGGQNSTTGPVARGGPALPSRGIMPMSSGGPHAFQSGPAQSGAVPFTGSAAAINSGVQPGAVPVGGTAAGINNTNLAPSSGGFGSLMQPYGQTFEAPTGLTEQNDPGYQARLNLGMQAMERSAAARGGVLTGGTLQAENQAAQDYASNEYNNVYNRALNTFGTDYNVYNQNKATQFNELAALSGVGQTTASQLGTLGNQASAGISSNLLGTAANMGQDFQNAAEANASGIVGSANAWSGALGNTGNNLSQLLLLKQLGMGGGGNGALTVDSTGSIISPGYN